jgi:hypothetical protein
MPTVKLISSLLSLMVMPVVASAEIIAADNLIYEPFPYSNYRTDIGYEHTVNGGFPNTAAAQPFVALASGRLTSIATLIRVWAGGEPLRVAVHDKAALGVGPMLGRVEFSPTLFPTSYYTSPPTVLDMEAAGIELAAGRSYCVVFSTATPVHATPRYSLHIMPPTEKSFGLGYWYSRNGVTFTATSLAGHEIAILAEVVPEPPAAWLLTIGGAVAAGQLRIARRFRKR